MAERFGRLPTWLGVAVAAVLLVAHIAYYAYIDVDDAYISYRYARNFARGDGLVYNPGQPPVEGYSNFLWVVMLAGAARLGFDIPAAARALGATLSVVAMTGTAVALRRSSAGKVTTWTACLWLAASGSYAMWSIGGLETTLLAALLVMALILLDHEERAGRGFASGFVLALVALARAEGAIFFAAAFAVRTAARLRRRSTRPPGEDAKWALAFALPFGAFEVWRIAYYGDWLPNTVHAKSGGGYVYRGLRGAYYAFQFLASGGALLALLGAAAAALQADRPLVRHALAGSLAYVALITFAGGDWMPMFRFFAPILPWLCALAAVGLAALSERLPAPSTVLAPVTGILVLAMFAGGSIQSQEIERTTRDFAAPSGGGHAMAAWLREHSQPGDSIALVDAGVLAYETDLRIIDMIGLNDRHIAHLPPRFPRGLGRGNGFGKWDTDYVLAHRPTFIQVHLTREQWERRDLRTDWVGADELVNDPRFLAQYDYVDDLRVNGIFRRSVP